MPQTFEADRAVPTYEMRGVAKRYGGVTALAGVDLAVYAGEVTAILGENGAGKSTLMKVLAGAEAPDAGTVLHSGAPTSFASVRDANDHGLAMVFQELTLFPELDVLANLFITREPMKFKSLVNRQEMVRRARPVLERLGVDIPLKAPVGSLTLGEQQLVEIARALLTEADTIVFDEPNSALSARETERLLRVVDDLRDRGVAIVWVSHRLEEVLRIADSLVIMRNGRTVARHARAETSMSQCIAEILGEPESPEAVAPGAGASVGQPPAAAPAPARARAPRALAAAPAAAGLEVRSLSTDDVADVSLSVASGEILGLAGLDGAGQREVLEAIFGFRKLRGGAIRLDGEVVRIRQIADAIRAGLAYVPPDRRKEGLILGHTVLENISSVRAGAARAYGAILDKHDMLARSRARCEELGIRGSAVARPAGELSGGNQQKVVLGKWLEVNPRVMLLDDPTRGVDIGAKAEIYELIGALAEAGTSVLFSSSEIREYPLICDRVCVFRRGRIGDELLGAAITESAIVEAINQLDSPEAARQEAS